MDFLDEQSKILVNKFWFAHSNLTQKHKNWEYIGCEHLKIQNFCGFQKLRPWASSNTLWKVWFQKCEIGGSSGGAGSAACGASLGRRFCAATTADDFLLLKSHFWKCSCRCPGPIAVVGFCPYVLHIFDYLEYTIIVLRSVVVSMLTSQSWDRGFESRRRRIQT